MKNTELEILASFCADIVEEKISMADLYSAFILSSNTNEFIAAISATIKLKYILNK